MRKTRQVYEPERGFVVEMFLQQTGDPPYAGILLVWYCDGSTEALCYSCPHCDHVFPPSYTISCRAEGLVSPDAIPYWTCPGCKRLVPDGDLRTCMTFRLTPQNIAVAFAHWFNKCERRATLRIRRFKSEHTFREALSYVGAPKYRDRLQLARSQKSQEWVVFPYSRLSRDLSSGADLVHTIEGFVKS